MLFFMLHEIKFDHRNNANPPIDLLLSKQSAQSAYEKPLATMVGVTIQSPKSMVPLTNLRILLTTTKWRIEGAWKY
jgi:hypothetical protein